MNTLLKNVVWDTIDDFLYPCLHVLQCAIGIISSKPRHSRGCLQTIQINLHTDLVLILHILFCGQSPQLLAPARNWVSTDETSISLCDPTHILSRLATYTSCLMRWSLRVETPALLSRSPLIEMLWWSLFASFTEPMVITFAWQFFIVSIVV